MIKLKEVTFLHRKNNNLNYDSMGIRENSDEITFTEYKTYINPDSIHSISEGYYDGTTDINYGSWETFMILKGTLDENMIKIFG